MQKNPHIVVSGSLDLFFSGAGRVPSCLSLPAQMQKEPGFSMQFLPYGQQDSWLNQETYTDIRYMCLVVVARRLKNLMTSCLKILTAGQMLME